MKVPKHIRILRRASGGLVVCFALGLFWLGAPTSAGAQIYEGADYCANCHPDYYNDWKVSGHPWKLSRSEVAQNRPLPLPEGYSWADISFVIGGYKWKSRYMGLDGYIITSVITSEGVVDGMNQYNMMTGSWSDYHPGELKPYNCGRCHTTGYSPEGNHDGLPGIVGTWEFEGVQCEACHGPGGSHGELVNRSAELCGSCHIRGDWDTIPAKGGFIRHHEQYNELMASPHRDLVCVGCHNPHKKAEFSITKECWECHGDTVFSYMGTTMQQNGVTCVDCHMPKATKSAQAFSPFEADVRTHLFRINADPMYQTMFTPGNDFVLLDEEGQGALTLRYACKRCHMDEDWVWIATEAQNFHQRFH